MSENTPELGRKPCMVNGRTTNKTYLVVAVREGDHPYNAIGIRKLGFDNYKFHFWPTATCFAIQEFALVRRGLYRREAGMSVCPYEGLVLNKADTEILLDHIKAQSTGLKVAPREQIFEALNGNLGKTTIDEFAIKSGRQTQSSQMFPGT